MANNNVATKLGLQKQKDQTWIDTTGEWKVIKGYKGYSVSHIPTGKVQSCVGITTLESASKIMKKELLKNTSYFK